MTKQTLIDRVADRLGSTKAEASRAVDAVSDEIADIVGNGGATIRLPGLGVFSRKHKAARTGRNPQTGEPVHITARDVVVFKASKKA